MVLMVLPSLRLLLQGCSNGLVLQTNALFLGGPPHHKLGLGLQFGLLRLYVPQRAALLFFHDMGPALQLLDLREGNRRGGGGLRDGLYGRQ
jgi:hypothetical protein